MPSTMTETLLMPTALPPRCSRRAQFCPGSRRWEARAPCERPPAGEISCVFADGLRGLGSSGICGWRGARIRPPVFRITKELKPERIDAL